MVMSLWFMQSFYLITASMQPLNLWQALFTVFLERLAKEA